MNALVNFLFESSAGEKHARDVRSGDGRDLADVLREECVYERHADGEREQRLAGWDSLRAFEQTIKILISEPDRNGEEDGHQDNDEGDLNRLAPAEERLRGCTTSRPILRC